MENPCFIAFEMIDINAKDNVADVLLNSGEHILEKAEK